MPYLRFVRDPQAGGKELPFILSYLGMRQVAGWVGFILPFAVALGNWPRSHGLESSISAYYFTRMGAWFAGSLWVIGFFMVSCRGYPGWDEIAGRFAGVFALGVALIPMNICGVKSGWVQYRGWLHWTCAALLFIVLALMCLKLFTRTDAAIPTPKKLRRNKCYVACGYTIFACIALIGVDSLLKHFNSSLAARLDCYKPIFWLEARLRFSLRHRLARQRRNLLVHPGLNDRTHDATRETKSGDKSGDRRNVSQLSTRRTLSTVTSLQKTCRAGCPRYRRVPHTSRSLRCVGSRYTRQLTIFPAHN